MRKPHVCNPPKGVGAFLILLYAAMLLACQTPKNVDHVDVAHVDSSSVAAVNS